LNPSISPNLPATVTLRATTTNLQPAPAAGHNPANAAPGADMSQRQGQASLSSNSSSGPSHLQWQHLSTTPEAPEEEIPRLRRVASLGAVVDEAAVSSRSTISKRRFRSRSTRKR